MVVIEVKAKQSKLPDDKGLLIREFFLLWYALLEGIECENFEEFELSYMLQKCTEKFRMSFQTDSEFLFIAGWSVSRSFWIFDNAFKEEEGIQMLQAAYKGQRENSLYKWAIRQELKLRKQEIEILEQELQSDFYHYYNYGPYIKEYFLDVISAPDI